MKPASKEEQRFVDYIAAQVAREMRQRLLRTLAEEKARHWKMRGQAPKRFGPGFERGFFRGLNHAHDIVQQILDPGKIRTIIRTRGRSS